MHMHTHSQLLDTHTSGGSSYSSMGCIEPPLWLDQVLRSVDDGPNGTPPWLKEIKKAIALAHFSMHFFQSKMD